LKWTEKRTRRGQSSGNNRKIRVGWEAESVGSNLSKLTSKKSHMASKHIRSEALKLMINYTFSAFIINNPQVITTPSIRFKSFKFEMKSFSFFFFLVTI
jgi:hypothetical protein